MRLDINFAERSPNITLQVLFCKYLYYYLDFLLVLLTALKATN